MSMRLIVIIISICLSLILVLFFDFLYDQYKYKPPKTHHYLLFSKIDKLKGQINSNILNKVEKFYVYESNAKIRHAKFLYRKDNLYKEYDYIINNYGKNESHINFSCNLQPNKWYLQNY